MIEALGPMLRRGAPGHEDPRLRPQLVRAPQRHRLDAARRDRGHQRLPPAGALLAAPPAGSPGPLTTATTGDPSAMSALHDAVPGQGHLLHRVLRKPVQRPREHVLGHVEVARPQPDHRLAAQLGEDRDQLERRARSVRRPARRRLRQLHADRHRRPRRHRHAATPSTTRSVTSAGSSSPGRSGSPAPRSGRPAGTAR